MNSTGQIYLVASSGGPARFPTSPHRVGFVVDDMLHAIVPPYVFHFNYVTGEVSAPSFLGGSECSPSDFSGGAVFDATSKSLFAVDTSCLYRVGPDQHLTQAVVPDDMTALMKPLVIGADVFVADTSGHVHCYNSATLQLRWSRAVTIDGTALFGLAAVGSELYAYKSDGIFHVSTTNGNLLHFLEMPPSILSLKGYNRTVLVYSEDSVKGFSLDLNSSVWDVRQKTRASCSSALSYWTGNRYLRVRPVLDLRDRHRDRSGAVGAARASWRRLLPSAKWCRI